MINVIQSVQAVQKVNQDRLRPKTKINHLNTKTTKLTNEIAERTAKDLEKITLEIESFLTNHPIYEARQKFKDQVGSIIASGVRDSFFAGFTFVEKFAQRTLKLNNLDIMNIEIQKAIDSYWYNLEKTHQKTNRIIVGAAGDSIFSAMLSFISTLAVGLSFSALGKGTVTAMRETIPLSFSVSISEETPQMMWISERDSSVCPVCLNIDGRVWNANDSTILYPVEDSHFGCRCRLMPFSKDKVFNG